MEIHEKYAEWAHVFGKENGRLPYGGEVFEAGYMAAMKSLTESPCGNCLNSHCKGSLRRKVPNMHSECLNHEKFHKSH